MCTSEKDTGAQLRRWEPWPLEPAEGPEQEAEGPEQEAEGPEQEAEGPEQEAEGRRDHRLANGIIWVNR